LQAIGQRAYYVFLPPILGLDAASEVAAVRTEQVAQPVAVINTEMAAPLGVKLRSIEESPPEMARTSPSGADRLEKSANLPRVVSKKQSAGPSKA
jgi:hypothetical protein